MKRFFLVIILIVLSLVLSSCLVSNLLDKDYLRRQKTYYGDTANFQNFSGELIKISYNSDYGNDNIVFVIKGWIIDDPDHYWTFVIEGKNKEIVDKLIQSNKICVGDIISFTSAPRIFWNGYRLPIVAITIDGESLLDFEEGYANYMETYS